MFVVNISIWLGTDPALRDTSLVAEIPASALYEASALDQFANELEMQMSALLPEDDEVSFLL